MRQGSSLRLQGSGHTRHVVRLGPHWRRGRTEQGGELGSKQGNIVVRARLPYLQARQPHHLKSSQALTACHTYVLQRRGAADRHLLVRDVVGATQPQVLGVFGLLLGDESSEFGCSRAVLSTSTSTSTTSHDVSKILSRHLGARNVQRHEVVPSPRQLARLLQDFTVRNTLHLPEGRNGVQGNVLAAAQIQRLEASTAVHLTSCAEHDQEISVADGGLRHVEGRQVHAHGDVDCNEFLAVPEAQRSKRRAGNGLGRLNPGRAYAQMLQVAVGDAQGVEVWISKEEVGNLCEAPERIRGARGEGCYMPYKSRVAYKSLVAQEGVMG